MNKKLQKVFRLLEESFLKKKSQKNEENCIMLVFL